MSLGRNTNRYSILMYIVMSAARKKDFLRSGIYLFASCAAGSLERSLYFSCYMDGYSKRKMTGSIP